MSGSGFNQGSNPYGRPHRYPPNISNAQYYVPQATPMGPYAAPPYTPGQYPPPSYVPHHQPYTFPQQPIYAPPPNQSRYNGYGQPFVQQQQQPPNTGSALYYAAGAQRDPKNDVIEQYVKAGKKVLEFKKPDNKEKSPSPGPLSTLQQQQQQTSTSEKPDEQKAAQDLKANEEKQKEKEREEREKEEKERKEKEEKERKEREEKEREEKEREEKERKEREEKEKEERERLEKEAQQNLNRSEDLEEGEIVENSNERTKVYLREYLLSFKDKFTTPPADFSMPDALSKPPVTVTTESPTRKPSNQGYQGFQGSPNSQTKRKVVPLPQPQERITQTSNAWKPSKTRPKNETELSLRKIKAILNKLTLENFDDLCNDIYNIEITSSDMLKDVIDLVFDKTVGEAHYSSMYAKLCENLQKRTPAFEEKKSFKKLLLDKCQQEFEKKPEPGLSPEELAKLTPLELEDYEYKRATTKRNTLGNMTFIGELFKLGMLSETIMHECIATLLTVVDEKDLECMCNLMKTVGKILDKPEAKQRMERYFQRIDSLSKNQKLPQRIRFMLMDIIDLRKAQWVPRRETMKAMKLDELHNNIEEENRKKAESMKSKSSGGSKGSTGSRVPPMSSQMNKQSALSNVIRRAPSTDEDNISLAPQKRSNFPPLTTTAPPKIEEKPKPEKVEKVLIPKDKFFNKVGAILEDLFETRDLKESIQASKEDFKDCDPYLGDFVKMALDKGLARKAQSDELLGKFFSMLFDNDVILLAHFTQGVKMFMVNLADIIIDSPQAGNRLGHIIFYSINKFSIEILNFLSFDLDRGVDVLASVLKKFGETPDILERLSKSKFDINRFFSKKEDADKWINDHKLSYLNEIPQTTYELVISDPKLEQAKKIDNEIELSKWVEENISSFSTKHFTLSFMMYILEKYEQKILDGTFFSKKGSIALPLTKVCATKNVFIELLYAAQIFYSEKEGKELDKVFRELYHNDIVPEESILDWAKKNEEEYPGKIKAVFAVEEFIKWLLTADEDDS